MVWAVGVINSLIDQSLMVHGSWFIDSPFGPIDSPFGPIDSREPIAGTKKPENPD